MGVGIGPPLIRIHVGDIELPVVRHPFSQAEINGRVLSYRFGHNDILKCLAIIHSLFRIGDNVMILSHTKVSLVVNCHCLSCIRVYVGHRFEHPSCVDGFYEIIPLPVDKSEYAVRGYLKWCLDCYTSVGDESNFERIRKKAISLYDEESIHHNYFNSMKYVKEKEVKLKK